MIINKIQDNADYEMNVAWMDLAYVLKEQFLTSPEDIILLNFDNS